MKKMPVGRAFLSRLAVSSLLLSSACSDTDGFATSSAQAPIYLGHVFNYEEALNGPWVTVGRRQHVIDGEELEARFRPASGVLLGNRVVLTAAHVVDGASVKVLHGDRLDLNGQTVVSANRSVIHRTYHRLRELWTKDIHGQKRLTARGDYLPFDMISKTYGDAANPSGAASLRLQDMGVDLALILLDEDVKLDPALLPVVCPPDVPDDVNAMPASFDVVSGAWAPPSFVEPDDPDEPGEYGHKNYANFRFKSTISMNLYGAGQEAHNIMFDHVTLGGAPNAVVHIISGDSGSGLFEAAPNGIFYPPMAPAPPRKRKLYGIVTSAAPPGKYGLGLGVAVRLAPYCTWIRNVVEGFVTNASFEKRRDINIKTNDGSVNGKLDNYVSSLTHSGIKIELAAGGVSETYLIPVVRPPYELAAAEVGTFSDGGPTLAFLDKGELRAYLIHDTVKESPTMIVSGATGAVYVDLLVGNTVSNEQQYNDLVAVRRDGEVDLFRGGNTGLQKVNAEVAITRINDDLAADLLVVDGDKLLVSVASGGVFSTDLTLVPQQTITANFTRAETGSGRDIALLGAVGEKSVVQFCKMSSDGSFNGACQELPILPERQPLRLTASDTNGDDYDDLVVTFVDPLHPAATFTGGPSGLVADGSAVGLPSAQALDGKFLLIGGSENTTAAESTAEFYISEPTSDDGTPTNTPLRIQIFDLDTGGEFDSLSAADVTACAQLYASPNPGVDSDVLLASVAEHPGMNMSWYTVFDSAKNGHSDAARSPSGTHWYRVALKLSDACNKAPKSDHSVFNAFKIRTNGQLRTANGLTLYGSDSIGPHSGFEFGPNTDYDGKMDLTFHVGGVERPEIPEDAPLSGITLSQTEADDTTDLASLVDFGFGGNADGQSANIFFELYSGSPVDGSLLQLKRTAGRISEDLNVPTTRVENPSGDGSGTDVVFEQHTTEGLASVAPGVYVWHWENVNADNAIQIQPVTGSPVNHEFVGAGGRWVSSSVAKTPAAMAQMADDELASLLPLDLGRGGFGHKVTVPNAPRAKALLNAVPGDLPTLLERELLTLKLNLAYAHKKGEPLESAFVLSTRISVEELIRAADELTAGLSSAFTQKQALKLMATANAGQVTYLSPNPLVISSGDIDKDGVIDANDNCPMAANADQADTNKDGIGDRCEPTPRVWCVEPDALGGHTAIFGYKSPLKDFRIPVGAANSLSGGNVSTIPPVLFLKDGVREAIAVPFTGDSVTWKVMGNEATATLEAPLCSEVGAGSLECQMADSEFHCCTSIENCDAAAEFALYATEALSLGERVRVINGDGSAGSILSLGAIEMASEAEVGRVLGGGELLLGSRVALLRELEVEGLVHGLVSGSPVLKKVPLDAPSLEFFIRPFEGRAREAQSINVGDSRALQPGSYGEVRAFGELTLESGEYHFTRLDLEESGVLNIVAQDGPVIVHIGGTVRLSGQIQAYPGELLLHLHGPGSAEVGASLAATIVAPEGLVAFTAPGTTQRGAVFARRIEVASDVTVLHSDPLRPR